MTRFLRKWFGSSVPSPVKSRPGVALQIDVLEDRIVPSTTASVSNGILKILGDAHVNNVTIVQNDTRNTLKVYEEVNGLNRLIGSAASNQVTQINVNLGAGNDRFTYRLDNHTGNAFKKSTNIDLGSGDDECHLDFGGGVGGGFGPLRGSLSFQVYGGLGNDTLFADFGRKEGGALSLLADMGDGNDHAYVDMWGDIVGGAVVKFNLNGGAGDDVLDTWNTFDNASNQFSDIKVASDSTFGVRMNGGPGNDTLGATYRGEADGKVTIVLYGDVGNDNMSANVKLQVGSTGSFAGVLSGADDNDNLAFTLLDNSGGACAVFGLADGGNGTATAGVITPNVVTVNIP